MRFCKKCNRCIQDTSFPFLIEFIEAHSRGHVKMCADENDWLCVSLPDGRIVYVSDEFIAVVDKDRR